MIRLGGISGIYKDYDFKNSFLEKLPLDFKSRVSVFHQKQIDILKLDVYNQVLKEKSNEKIDIFMSHDWPTKIYNFGNKFTLLKIKPYFKDEVYKNILGSPALNYLLNALKP